ncbi:hypothetical protein ACFFSY_16565 [Paenibacillus aurantiacus]|uniref:Uncharacterized protein n=1 Tax=Paenibacillus aurantiacus TaxID=1936118 RepID=A0ABV5KQP0_9BACL
MGAFFVCFASGPSRPRSARKPFRLLRSALYGAWLHLADFSKPAAITVLIDVLAGPASVNA